MIPPEFIIDEASGIEVKNPQHEESIRTAREILDRFTDWVNDRLIDLELFEHKEGVSALRSAQKKSNENYQGSYRSGGVECKRQR